MNLQPLSRRAFLERSALVLATSSGSAACVRALLADDATAAPKLRIGLVTDLHYADKPAAGTRYYRETPDKLARAVEQFRRDKVDFTVELGDLVDAADSVEEEQGWLRTIHRQLASIPGGRHYVLGNHCVQTLTKEEFLAGVERERSHYSFAAAGWHFVVLDACFRSDGQPYGRNNFTWTDANLPEGQLEWLAADLSKADGRTIVFIHQRLDEARQHSVKNAAAVRTVLERSGKVAAVFQGHSHQNDYQQIAGIHYCTVAAMVEGSGEKHSAFARLDVLPGGGLRLEGFVRQQNYAWPA
jgi:3',5'-cyclic AMP phosphodiesterase CpdA